MNKDNFFPQIIFLSIFFVMPLYSAKKPSSEALKIISLFLHTGLHVPGGDFESSGTSPLQSSKLLPRDQGEMVRAPKHSLLPPVRPVISSFVYNARLGCVVTRDSLSVVALIKKRRSATKGWKPGLPEVEEETNESE